MEFADLKTHERDVEYLKLFFKFTISSYDDGACFFATDLDKVTDKLINMVDKFDIPDITKGQRFSADSLATQAVQARKTIVVHFPPMVYGIRVTGLAGPVWNNNDSEIIGTWGLCVPEQHKLTAAFDAFAPILAELLPEGGVLLVSNREKIIKRQGSQKYDIPEIKVNDPLVEGTLQYESIKANKQLQAEVDASGFPTLIVSSPLQDEKGLALGSFTICLPRKLASDLKEIANALDQGLTGVSSAVEQISAATNDASNNQMRLNSEIEQVKGKLENIDNVMAFTKEIADETKMLGLNAAIEAARVGDAGRGFGVVADEIRKLSEESKNTVTKIKKLTAEIEKCINNTADQSQSTLAGVQQTAAATQEVNATLEEMTAMASKLASTVANL